MIEEIKLLIIQIEDDNTANYSYEEVINMLKGLLFEAENNY
jgi:hypothetical protein